MPRRVYLDHNATTPVRPEVLEAMLPFLREAFGNPNSVHRPGQEARAAVEEARRQVAGLLGAEPEEIVFTSCGSESDALAVAGAAYRALRESGGRRNHLVASSVEHDAVRETLSVLGSRGFEVSWVGVDGHGRVNPEEVGRAVRDKTSLVTVMHANNEVGTLQPIAEVVRAVRRVSADAILHTDAVQSAGKVPLDVRALGVDLLSISGHKLNAPKGIGALYVRKGVLLDPMVAGHQEKNRRGGTENVAGLVGLGRACELAAREMAAHAREVAALRVRLEEGILSKVPRSRLNGHPALRLPGTCHFSFEGVDGHQLVIALDLEGIAASSGPACSSGASLASHVLEAMGVPEPLCLGSLRLSLGWGSVAEDVEAALRTVPEAVRRLREVVPA